MKNDVLYLKIPVNPPYKVIIGENILDQAGKIVYKLKKCCNAYIITDHNVSSLYLNIVEKSLIEKGFKTFKYIFKAGENSKSVSTLIQILENMAQKEINRSDIIIALGGGVVGDISGFAAAVYLRGIDYIQIPTTFLSAIDSSVGGKTGVNLKQGKNLMGAFKQPLAVIFDSQTLNTLSEEVFADGIAEAIKYGVLKSPGLFEKLKAYSRNELMQIIPDIVSECVSIKGDIVSSDEFDKGERQLLNLGHTIGHAIEKCSNYTISHGRAIAAGMAILTKGALKIGLINNIDIKIQIFNILEKFFLPTTIEATPNCKFTAKELYTAVLSDKKRNEYNINIILPLEIGRCVLKKISLETLYNIILEGLDG